MKTSSIISEAQDARNCRVIRVSMTNNLLCRRTPELHSLLHDGTPAERAEYVRQYRRRVLVWGLVLAVVAGAMGLSYHEKVAPSPPTESETPAGAIQSLQLHQTSFSTSTTLVTTNGTYQVYGAVSASSGDHVNLKTEKTQYGEKKSVCVTSEIKSACYQLL
ncbi:MULTISPECIES: hypothetical protein [Pseudomonas]|uniref:Uncharacterized protein n=1 Tax=Pseudomonas fluorescens TaxID=294 RepID=A0A161XFW6_PSEFL|nr:MULTISPECIES: hypothetical protein [Pseudomonas]KZN20708.1 hypothetical protein A1D17_03975 [Pseudomonas fluorescens]